MLRNGWGESILCSSGFTRCFQRYKSNIVSAATGKPKHQAALIGISAPGSGLTCWQLSYVVQPRTSEQESFEHFDTMKGKSLCLDF